MGKLRDSVRSQLLDGAAADVFFTHLADAGEGHPLGPCASTAAISAISAAFKITRAVRRDDKHLYHAAYRRCC